MLSDKEIDFLENKIPILAEFATKQAFINALASGSSVMIARNGQLIEISADGTEKFIKEIDKPIKVKQRVFNIINNVST